MSMKSVWFMRVIGLQKLLTFGAIRLLHQEFIGKKPRWGIFPQNFWSSLAQKLLVGLKKKSRTKKWYGHPLSSCKVWWRSAARKKQKFGVCFCLFVSLFVKLWILNRSLVIQIAILSPFVGQF